MKTAHDSIQSFCDCLFASIYPEPLEDAEADERNDYARFIQTSDLSMCHPYAVDPRTMLQISSTEKTTLYHG